MVEYFQDLSYNMFTGIVEEIGTVIAFTESNSIKLWDGSEGQGVLLTVQATPALCEGAYLGASIAINGVCLTIVDFSIDSFTFGVSPETYVRCNSTASDCARTSSSVHFVSIFLSPQTSIDKPRKIKTRRQS